MQSDSAPIPPWKLLVLGTLAALLFFGGLVCVSGQDLLVSFLPLLVVAGWFSSCALAMRWRSRSFLVVLGTIPVAVLLAGLLSWPAVGRAAVSQDALASASGSEGVSRSGTRIGLYWVNWSRKEAGCTIFVTESLLGDESGVAYCPDGRPRSPHLDHLVGNVYSYLYVR